MLACRDPARIPGVIRRTREDEDAMRAQHLWPVGLLAALSLAGCQGAGSPRRVAVAEPGLALPGDSGPVIAEAPPPVRPVTVVERHPLLSKPRDYYENSGNNKIVKTAAATFIGVPAGIVGEMRQIVVGKAPGTP
jgi:hypothetical protein